MNSVFKVLTFVATMVWWQSNYGQTLYVDSSLMFSGGGGSWATAFASLGDALDSAHKNPAINTILVAKGTYYPNHYPYDMNSSQIGVELNTSRSHEKTFHLRTGLEVYGGYPIGGGTRNIDANPTVLRGFININGDTTLHIVLMDTSTNWTNSNDTTILDGFHVLDGYAVDVGDITVNSSDVFSNSGAGIYINKGSHLIRNCTISNYHTQSYGGGIAAFGANIYLIKNKIVNNICIGDGAGVYMNGTNSFFLQNLIDNNNLVLNFSANGTGGGLSALDGTHYFYNNIISNNKSFSGGGGANFTLTTSFFVNNTFYRNECKDAISYGGGYFADGGTTHTFYNNIFWENKSNLSIDSPGSDIYNKSSVVIAKNNNFQLDSIKISTLPLATSTKNLYKTSPQFKGGSGADSLSLLPTSLLIDKGDSSLYNTEKLDFLSADRIQNTEIDLGAIETFTCISRTDVYDTICSGDSVNFGGTQLKLAGVYIDTFMNILACDSIVTLHLLVSSITTGVTVRNVNCFGDSTGSIILSPSGGVSPYNINWSNGATTTTINNLKAGSYIYTYTDAVGCIVYPDTIEITQPATAISYSTLVLNTTCYARTDGKIKLEPIGGTPPYTFVWSNGGTLDSIVNIGAGNYTCTIKDANNCSVSVTGTINEPNPIASAYNHSICSGSSYFFNGNNLSVSGTYHDTFTAANGCDSFVMLNLTVLPNKGSNLFASICKGKTYLFNGIQQSVMAIYYDTFTAANGCDSIITLYLTVTNPPVITTQDSSNFASAYSWRGKSFTSAGTYYDTSSATNKCDTIFKLILTLDTSSTPIPPLAMPLHITFSNDTLYASFDSATSYQWYLCGPPMRKITGATKRFFYTKDKSNYTVVVIKNGETDTAACGSNSSIIISKSNSGISYFPNPVLQKLNVELTEKHLDITLSIYDIKGQKLWTREYRELMKATIDMSSFSQGLYFLEFNADKGFHQIVKLVKDDE